MPEAWIIEWGLQRGPSPIRDLRPHILPRRWKSDRVLDYMRCVFWNSSLWTPFESLSRVNKAKPEGIYILQEGRRLIYGDASHLIAWRVKDLRILQDASGNVVMEWTGLPGVRFESRTETFHPLGEPCKRRYVWRGHYDAAS